MALRRRAKGGAPTEPSTVRKIRQGELVGLLAENGAHVWRGVPYAASTAGANRWRAPQPASGWEGRREAIRFAERCVQLTNDLDRDEGLKPGLVVGSEDCLALDLYAPPNADARALPVVVWIHGGGNVWGRSSAYDGSRLAVNEDVLVVAVQYRVGPLGWFAHEALRTSARGEDDAGACFAILDLIASLGWVRDNIEAFGCDPGNVTIAGESSGGHNVVALLASPRAKRLFHRAIVQSGAFESVSLAEAEGEEGDLANPSSRITEQLGATTAEALREVPVAELLAAFSYGGSGFLDVPRVIEDGVTLPTGPLRDAFSSIETFNPTPILMGTNRDEMKLFYVRDERLTKRSLGVFPVARDPAFYDLIADYVSRVWRIRAVDEPAALMGAAGHTDVYAYRFDWDGGGRLLTMDFAKALGAAHGFEMPFVFNRFQHLGRADKLLFRKETAELRETLSRTMGAYWASFARDGVPYGPGAPSWSAYGEEGGSVMRLDTEDDGGIQALAGPDGIEALGRDLSADQRLDADQRCMIVEEMDRWMFARPVRSVLQAATGCT
ncbi:MAG: carboxylesterase/lipase family protein [Solirubrobacterales bacterium]